MTQFTAYQNPNAASQERYPYLLDIQSDLLGELRTTIVVPLCPAAVAAPFTISRLNPTVEVHSAQFVVMVQDIAGIDRAQLGAKVKDLGRYRNDIVAALDFVISGL